MASNVPQDWLQVQEYDGPGFLPLASFGKWRVAILNFEMKSSAQELDRVERHTNTDEVFVLLRGRAVLLLGGVAPQIQELQTVSMRLGSIYNVRRNSWHASLLSHDASILIVEEADTGPQNTDFLNLSAEDREGVRSVAAHEGLP